MIKNNNQHTVFDEMGFVNESVRSLCLKHGTLLTVKKNTVFFDEDTLAGRPFVYYLVDGVCSICGYSVEGQEQTFNYQMPGEIIGHTPYLISNGAFDVLYFYRRPSVMTKTDCTVYKIPVNFFLDYVEHDIQFSNYLLRNCALSYDMMISHLKQVQEDPAVVAICRFLLRFRTETKEGPIVPKLFTYKEISRYFGIHEFTVSRIIGKLREEGYVEKLKSGLKIINEKRLQEIIMQPDSFKY